MRKPHTKLSKQPKSWQEKTARTREESESWKSRKGVPPNAWTNSESVNLIIMSNAYVRAKRPDGSECTIDLIELETALEGDMGSTYLFFPETGKIVFRPGEDPFGIDEMDDEDEQDGKAEGTEVLTLDRIPSHERFRWMEDFIETVYSVSARSALRNALNQKKPFRHFKDALLEFPAVRQQWFQFEARKLKEEAIDFIESLDWEILKVVDRRPVENVSPEIEPAERLQPTGEEREWILRAGSEIAAKGGRSQLALLLKGSKDKKLLKHHLQNSPAYGKLSFLTLEEIENRIDHLIRLNELRVEFFGDFPLILLSDAAWEHVRPWSNEQECRRAAAADDRTLNEILLQWRNRPRPEQFHLLDAVTSLDPDSERWILQAWREVAGKEVRTRIEEKLRSST